MLSENNTSGEVKQAGTGSVMEVEACSEMQDPAGASVGNSEEITTTRACSAHKISLTTASKPAQGCELVVVGPLDPGAPTAGTSGEAESGGSASRKRRWGSSTTATAKQQQPTISTDSLKSVIPDVKPAVGLGNQEVVVELHPEEGHLSEDEERGRTGELKVQRTVTQVVSVKKQENGQKEGLEEEEEEEAQGGGDGQRVLKEERKDCSVVVTMEMQTPPTPEADAKKVLPNKTLVHRSVSQQKSGVSVTIDDPVCSAQLPSSPRGKITNIIHICNLVRPFTLGQLKELLSRTGTVVEDGFCIDKIKSNCYVTYPSVEEAAATRTALHGVKWPQSNPKFLRVGFCEQDELDFHRALFGGVGGGDGEEDGGDSVGVVQREGGAAAAERDQQAQRQRERERRERARAEREWDRDKVRDFSQPEEPQRSPSHQPEHRYKHRKSDKKEDPPGKLLDDLFCKTQASPCIYWLPLTDQQVLQKAAERAERMKEREKRRKEQQQEEDRKRGERRERAKGRGKEAVGVAGGGGASQAVEGERERERDGENEREKVREKEDRGREEREKGSGREEKERQGEREEREKVREKELRGREGSGREERGREREERDREERDKRRDSYRGRGVEVKSGGSRNLPPPRDRRR